MSEGIYEKIKDRKPFWLPKFVWNKAVNTACDAFREYVSVSKASEIVATGVVKGVAKALDGKSDDAVETVCSVAEKGCAAFSKISAAAKDKQITAEEQADIASSVGEVIASFVSQEELDDKVAEVRSALLFV